MLKDLNDPRALGVFAAAKQEDLILDYCMRITLAGTSARSRMLEMIRPCFAALRWLNKERFGNLQQISSGIADLEAAIESLVRLPLIDPEPDAVPNKCPACGRRPTSSSNYSKTAHCPSCLESVMPHLNRIRSCDEGFGTVTI